MATDDELVKWTKCYGPQARRHAACYAVAKGTPPNFAEQNAEDAVREAVADIVGLNAVDRTRITSEAHYQNLLVRMSEQRVVNGYRRMISEERARQEWAKRVRDVLGVSEDGRNAEERAEQVHAAIDELDESQRALIVRYFFGGEKIRW